MEYILNNQVILRTKSLERKQHKGQNEQIAAVWVIIFPYGSMDITLIPQ